MAARKGNLNLVSVLLPTAKKPYTRNAAKAVAAEVALAEAPGSAGHAIAELIVAAGGDPGESGGAIMKLALVKKADGVAALVRGWLKASNEHALCWCVVEGLMGSDHQVGSNQ